jgi:hypothetical protein
MDIITDPRIVNAVRAYVESSAWYTYVQQVLERTDKPAYLWGGAVRDPLLKLLIGLEKEKGDVDMVLDISLEEAEAITATLSPKTTNRFHTVKWLPEPELEIDISCFLNGNRVRYEGVAPTLEHAVTGCDLRTSALAYNLRHPAVYSDGAVQAIQERTTGIHYERSEPLPILMTRVVLHAEYLQFAIDPATQRFIRQHYNPEQDIVIRNYLRYKRKESLYNLVIATLQSIAQPQKPQLACTSKIIFQS